jgi:hypothetical protein
MLLSRLSFFLLVFIVFPILPAFPLSAQAARAAGRVLTADSTPVRGKRVLLHRIGPEAQGPIDSALTDRSGRFRFSFRPDSGAFYLVSAQYSGIEYFSRPVATNPQRSDTSVRVIVYDTSSTAPVALDARHIVVTRPGEDGSRSVLDLMVLTNNGTKTRVASDTLRPTWSGPLPSGTLGLELAESDFSRDAVGRRGDSVVVVAPLAPGEKQLTVQYLIPATQSSIRLPVRTRGVSLNVLAEEPGTQVAGAGLTLADSQVLQGRSFRRWTGVSGPNALISIVLPPTRRTPEFLLAALVGTVVLVLAFAGWRLLRVPSRAVSNADLIDAIAALDARYAGRESETAAAEWQRYIEQRASLKAQLSASLAAGQASL